MSKKFDLDEFIKFVGSKPADEEYDGGNSDVCALAQFGLPGVRLGNREKFGVPESVYFSALFGDKTFGALASRLSALKERVDQ